jgi:hypothetical protein
MPCDKKMEWPDNILSIGDGTGEATVKPGNCEPDPLAFAATTARIFQNRAWPFHSVDETGNRKVGVQ